MRLTNPGARQLDRGPQKGERQLGPAGDPQR
jgi:hypothetical protein